MTMLNMSRQIDPVAVQLALATVQDPELRMALPKAGMVDEVELGRAGTVRVRLRLTTPSCPLKDTLVRDVTTAISVVPGVRRVEVSFSSMTERERLELADRLRGAAGVPRIGSDSRTRVYAVASGKGGVGKSTVTANLAVALAEQGQRVGLIDADVWGYSIPQLFGIRRSPVALKGLILPVEAHGVQLMSVGFFVEDDQPVVWRGPMLHKAIEQFLGDVYWGGDLDVLLLDLPPGTGDVTLSVLELVPDAGLLAVTTPQRAARTVAERVGRLARNARMPIAGVVENMSSVACRVCGERTALFGSGGGRQLAESIDAPLLGQVPLELVIREAGDLGTPAVLHAPEAQSTLEFRRIAGDLPLTRRSLVGRSLPLSVV